MISPKHIEGLVEVDLPYTVQERCDIGSAVIYKRCDISCVMCPTLQHILVGERTSRTSHLRLSLPDELPSASVVQPGVRGDTLQEFIKEHKCSCVSYDWLDIDSIRCEHKSDTDETNRFISGQVERERCAQSNIIITCV